MPAETLKLPFGLRDGLLVHVGEVAQGAACGCVCPACGSALVAKKGTRKFHHFAHASAECSHGVESALHRAGKEAIESAGEILLPAVLLRRGRNRPSPIAPQQMIRPDSVRLESRIEGMIPDIVLTVGGRDLLVEICVTHAVDETKLAKIRALGLSVLEISIGHLPRDLPFESLREAVIRGPKNRQWLYNMAAAKFEDNLAKLATSLPHVRRGAALHVDGCPIEARVWNGKVYANVIDDCIGCKFCFDAGLGEADSGAVACLGRSGISSYEEFRRVQARSGAGEA